MDTGKLVLVRDEQPGSNARMAVGLEFSVRTPLHEGHVETDFVHLIRGRILMESEHGGEEEIGHVEASLVQFSEAMDHGISTDRLGDGIDGAISEYWECLFDPNGGFVKNKILDEYDALGCDLLVIDCVQVVAKFRGQGVARSAIERTIEIFGAGCGLVACKPWPLQFVPRIARDRTLLKRLSAPDVRKEEALSKLRKYWTKMGFRPLGDTGIYLRSMAFKTPRVASEQV